MNAAVICVPVGAPALLDSSTGTECKQHNALTVAERVVSLVISESTADVEWQWQCGGGR